ncbi:MAG: sugar ABC transporter substrate-binding protein [Chloroflexia bacterium]|nr:sugar ABC transporter substrate-binding protein [Chloroflexia bacterium]MDQ3613094.1 sugar ABC transporter substrate-binding protein [Chloroflexota bacterium]
MVDSNQKSTSTPAQTGSIKQSSTVTRRRLLHGSAALAGSVAGASVLGSAAASGGAIRRPAPFNLIRQDPAELVFTYWGSPQEQEAVAQMTEGFNAEHPDITVRPQYVANDGYSEKMTTMLAGGNPPDLAYMGADMAFQWALDGQTLDLSPWVEDDPETPTLLDGTTYRYDDGTKVLSTSLAISNTLLYYNKPLFEEAEIEAPPVDAASAWTWDEFVEVCKLLTKDRDGRNATDPDFNAENIDVYGVAANLEFGPVYMPLIWSNGGDYALDGATEFGLNKPEAVEVFQRLQDLIYVHHVAPTPAQSSSLPSSDVLMRTGKLAMDINGMWKVLDYSQSEELEWGMGVLPMFKEPHTSRFGIPLIVSSACEYPDQAYEFYRWRYSPERIDLYEQGLWMPIQSSYYTEEDKISQWIDPDVFPQEARQVLVDYTLNYATKQMPEYYVKNMAAIQNEAVEPALSAIAANEGTAQELLDQAAETAQPLMQGSYLA